MRKKILAFFTMLSLALSLVVPVSAQENSIVLDDIQIKMTESDISFLMKFKDTDVTINDITVTCAYEDGSVTRNQYGSVDYGSLTKTEEGYWKIKNQQQFTRAGNWHVQEITVQDNNYNSYKVDLGMFYPNFNIDQLNSINGPAIRKIICKDDLSKPINKPYLSFDVDGDISDNSVVSLFYKVDGTSYQSLRLKYDDCLGCYVANIESNLKYNYKNFVFEYVLTQASGDMQRPNTVLVHNYYSNMPTEALKNLIETEDKYPMTQVQKVYNPNECKLQNLDFSLDSIEDKEAPALDESSVKWEKDVVNVPGYARLQFSATDNDIITSANLYYTRPGEQRNMVSCCSEKVVKNEQTNKYDIEIPIKLSAYKDYSEMKFVCLELIDAAGNRSTYKLDENAYNSWKNEYSFNQYVEHDFSQFPKLPQLVKFNDYEKNYDLADENLLSKLETDLEEGKTYVINKYKNKIVDKRIFELIQGKNIKLIFDDVDDGIMCHGIQWVINGKDVTNPKTIDVSTLINYENDKMTNESKQLYGIEDYSYSVSLETANYNYFNDLKSNNEGAEYYFNYLTQFDFTKDNLHDKLLSEYLKYETPTLKFKDNGELPGKMTIRYNPDYTDGWYITNSNWNCYFVNGDQLDLIKENMQLMKDDFYEFDITHNSTYVFKHPAETGNTNVKLPEINKNEEVKDIEFGVDSTDETKSMIINSANFDLKEKMDQAINEGNDVNTEVYINKITKDQVTSNTLKEIEKVAATNRLNILNYFDISIQVKSGDNLLGHIDETQKKIKFEVAIPTDLMKKGRIFKVIRVHGNEVTVLDTEENNGILTFESDRFSTYALAYVDNDKQTNDNQEPTKKDDGQLDGKKDNGNKNPSVSETPSNNKENVEVKASKNDKTTTKKSIKTGDNTNSTWYVLLAVITMLGITLLLKKELTKD